MKKPLMELIIGFFIFTVVVHANDEVVYNTNTNTLNIPKVLVGSTYYTVDMQQTEGLNFSVTNATPLTSDTIVWPSGNNILSGQWTGRLEFSQVISGISEKTNVEVSLEFSSNSSPKNQLVGLGCYRFLATLCT
jgi:hypothetical protein